MPRRSEPHSPSATPAPDAVGRGGKTGLCQDEQDPTSSESRPRGTEETKGRRPKKRRAPSPGTALTQVPLDVRYTLNFVLCGKVSEAVTVVCTSWFTSGIPCCPYFGACASRACLSVSSLSFAKVTPSCCLRPPRSCRRPTRQCPPLYTDSGLADLVASTDELYMSLEAALTRYLVADAATLHFAGVATASTVLPSVVMSGDSVRANSQVSELRFSRAFRMGVNGPVETV